jgi:F-box-like
MAPQLRSGKGFTRDEIIGHEEAIRLGTANTTGLPALPTELLFEIISHFPAVPLPMGKGDHCTVYPASYLEKPRILRALSQMCRSLRSVFLPYVWQKIEVCANSRMPEYSSVVKRRQRPLVSKELATELITQLEIVTIRDPTLAQHVKYGYFLHPYAVCSAHISQDRQCIAHRILV